MRKINFENSPSTNTPINSTNLNQMQTNTEDELFYKDGDIYTTGNDYKGGFCAFITTSATWIIFDIILPKRMDYIESVDVTSLRIRARSITGTYLLSGSSSYCDVFTNLDSQDNPLSSNCTSVDTIIVGENQLRITIKFDNDIYEINNCPLALEYRNMELTFNSASTASEE